MTNLTVVIKGDVQTARAEAFKRGVVLTRTIQNVSEREILAEAIGPMPTIMSWFVEDLKAPFPVGSLLFYSFYHQKHLTTGR